VGQSDLRSKGRTSVSGGVKELWFLSKLGRALWFGPVNTGMLSRLHGGGKSNEQFN